MNNDSHKKPPPAQTFNPTAGSPLLEDEAQERADFNQEFSELSGLDLKEYFKYYPDYFRDAFESLYSEKSDAAEAPFFHLNLDVPSPLCWLLLNEPAHFLLACEKCIGEYKKKFKDLSTGAKEKPAPAENRGRTRS